MAASAPPPWSGTTRITGTTSCGPPDLLVNGQSITRCCTPVPLRDFSTRTSSVSPMGARVRRLRCQRQPRQATPSRSEARYGSPATRWLPAAVTTTSPGDPRPAQIGQLRPPVGARPCRLQVQQHRLEGMAPQQRRGRLERGLGIRRPHHHQPRQIQAQPHPRRRRKRPGQIHVGRQPARIQRGAQHPPPQRQRPAARRAGQFAQPAPGNPLEPRGLIQRPDAGRKPGVSRTNPKQPPRGMQPPALFDFMHGHPQRGGTLGVGKSQRNTLGSTGRQDTVRKPNKRRAPCRTMSWRLGFSTPVADCPHQNPKGHGYVRQRRFERAHRRRGGVAPR